ncbi:MAG: hypothetical protein CM15mP62_18910 [Rhodospirillaceae bacterium]|nr:MAG: hypothetical protein CM15mP62_18910 [Rhodospirillaceae bacterium]
MKLQNVGQLKPTVGMLCKPFCSASQMAYSPLQKLARIKGMENFRGTAFHTSRWDYNIDLTGKRVGIIGTGATAVQVIPEIEKVVKDYSCFKERHRLSM